MESLIRIKLEGAGLILYDPLLLEDGVAGMPTVAERMQGYECLCLVVVLGPKLAPLLEHIAAAENKRLGWQQHGANAITAMGKSSLHTETERGPVSSSCFCRPNVNMMVVRAAARTTEAMREYLKRILNPLTPIVGTGPYTSQS
jgi:hypothetical protein